MGAAKPPTQLANKPAKITTHKLFQSFHNGFGDSRDVRTRTKTMYPLTPDQIQSRYNRIHGAFDARWVGELRFGLACTKIASTNHDLQPVYATEWTDTNGIYPVVFYAVGRHIQKLRFGVVTEVGASALPANCTSGTFDDDGSGIPYIYFGFGGATGSQTLRRMNLAQSVTSTNNAAGAGDVVANLLLSLNGKMYRTIQPTGGGTQASQVSVCPYGRDRMVNANWSAGVTLGFAGTVINALAVVRQAPVAIKPEGIFVYNEGLDRWIDVTPSWWTFQHLDNGKGAFTLGDVLVIPMGDGGCVLFDGNTTKPFDPGGLIATPNVHTTRDQFSALGAMRHWIIGSTPPDSKLIFAGDSLRFFKFTSIGSVFTDFSTQVRDSDLTSGATFTIASGDKIYVGWSRPFSAIRFDTGLANTVASTMSAKVSTDGTTFNQSITLRDFTTLSGATLGQSETIVMMQDPNTVAFPSTWQASTVNGVAAYWVELSFASGAFPLTASVTWLNCLVQPLYLSCDPVNFPLDGLDKSGNFPHMLFGRASTGDQQTATWHDMFSLSEPDRIGPILFCNVGGTNLNHSRHLVAIGRFGVWRMQMAPDDRPGEESTPFLNDKGLIEGPGVGLDDYKLSRIKEIRLYGANMPPGVVMHFYIEWDAGKKWEHIGRSIEHFPAVIRPDATRMQSRGNRLRWALGFVNTNSGSALAQPFAFYLEADIEEVPGRIDAEQERVPKAVPQDGD